MKEVHEHTWTIMYEGDHGFILKCEDPCPKDEQSEGDLRACSCAMGLTEEPSLELFFKLKDVHFRVESESIPDTVNGPAEVLYVNYVMTSGRVEDWR